MFWDDEQAYTDCLNDSSRHISLCVCTRSELVQWDHKPETDVRKCWSKRWVVWWALLVNSQETEIVFYCTESESVHNKMLFEQWRKVAFSRKTLSIELRTSLYRTYSVYTWLNNDWTLKKKCNWCSFITTILLIRNVVKHLYILSKLWQVSYKQQLKELLTRILKASICTEENLTKDIHWLCSESAVKWELYKPFDDYRLSQQESDTEIMQRDDCKMSGSDIHTTFLLSL